jgi:phage-related protein
MRKIKITITIDNGECDLTDEIPNSQTVDDYVSTLIKKYIDSDEFLCFITENDKGYKAMLINKTKINTIEITEIE